DLHPAGSPLDEVQRRVGDAELAGEVLTPAAEAPVGSACGFDGADLGVCGAVVPLAGEACGGFGGERFAPLVGGWEPASDDAVGVVGCRPKLGEERVEGVEVGSGEVGSVVEVGGGEVAGAVDDAAGAGSVAAGGVAGLCVVEVAPGGGECGGDDGDAVGCVGEAGAVLGERVGHMSSCPSSGANGSHGPSSIGSIGSAEMGTSDVGAAVVWESFPVSSRARLDCCPAGPLLRRGSGPRGRGRPSDRGP